MHSTVILLADPDEPTLARLRPLLERRGYVVLEARDGDAAFAIAADVPVDLIITELYLATGGERCLVRAVRSAPAFRHVRILAHTAYAGREHRVWAARSGADDYRLKSADPERLPSIVARLLSLHDAGERTAPIRAS